MSGWNFFTNYGHIIFLLSMEPELTLREVAQKVGITERATQKIIHDLEKDGFLKISKVGRQNSYKIIGRKKLRHNIEKNCRIDELINLVSKKN
ncbi:MAG: winged helix-turn-helix transcriptional regulator [Bdellovibrionales bacterium]|nr:winged helix-turn-helix transcriptional regulator [Bdellovibrionales bacterium]